MATRVALAKFEWHRLIGQPPKPLVWCKILGPILNVSWVIVICVWNFPNFRYHGNRGWSDTNYTYTVKSADSENPLFGAKILMISHTQAELYAIFWQSLPNFVTMATRVCLAKIWMTPFDRPTPKTPSLVPNSGTYLECELSYGKFCVEISKFSFPWQQGLVWHKFANFAYTVKLADLENPLFGARILMISLIQTE